MTPGNPPLAAALEDWSDRAEIYFPDSLFAAPELGELFRADLLASVKLVGYDGRPAFLYKGAFMPSAEPGCLMRPAELLDQTRRGVGLFAGCAEIYQPMPHPSELDKGLVGQLAAMGVEVNRQAARIKELERQNKNLAEALARSASRRREAAALYARELKALADAGQSEVQAEPVVAPERQGDEVPAAAVPEYVEPLTLIERWRRFWRWLLG